jgi:GMP synthase (glutamine-hydrolysing)
LDKRQPNNGPDEVPSVAFLAPPTDRDYPREIQRILRRYDGPTPSTVRFEPHRGEIPDRVDFDLIVVTGSSARIGDPEPWFSPLADYLRRAVRFGTPVLGVCFGHQFLADLFGGTVESLPERQVSVSTIEQTEAARSHPLFRTLPERFDSFVYHHDHVAELPPDATCLARNETGIQAFALEDRFVLGIQFHPEFTASMARGVGYDGPVEIDPSTRIYPNVLAAVRPPRSRPQTDA